MIFRLRMESNEATVRGEPEIALSILENPQNWSIWQAVFACEQSEGSGASVECFETSPGADPQLSLAVLEHGAHAIVGRDLELPRRIAIDGELVCAAVKAAHAVASPHSQRSGSILE